MNVQALESDIQGVFNLGTGKPHSLLDVLEYLQEFTGYETSPKVTGEYRPGDNRHDYADVSKLIRCLNTRQFTDLRDGMKKLSEWAVSAGAIDLFDKEEKERRKFLSN